MMKFVFLMAILAMMQVEGCDSGPYLGPEYGVVTLTAESGQEFYFKRTVSGLNYDVVVLSSNKDYCSQDAQTDYIFSTAPESLYYKVENNVLHLYTSYPDISPKQNSVPAEVKQYKLATGDFFIIDKIQREKELTHLVVPIDEKLRCP